MSEKKAKKNVFFSDLFGRHPKIIYMYYFLYNCDNYKITRLFLDPTNIIMVRGHAKAIAQEKNAKKQAAKEKSTKREAGEVRLKG